MKRLNYQICRFDGKDSFIELMSNSLPIGKMQINFRKYDKTKTKGNKFTQQVDIYIKISEALVLCHDILSGKIAIEAANEKKKGDKYPKPIWQSLGGKNAEKAGRPDGKALSRVIKLAPGSVKPFVLTAESGVGEEDDKGLIVPKYGTKPENRVIVALTGDQLKQLAILMQYHIQGFITAEYIKATESLPNAYEVDTDNFKK